MKRAILLFAVTLPLLAGGCGYAIVKVPPQTQVQAPQAPVTSPAPANSGAFVTPPSPKAIKQVLQTPPPPAEVQRQAQPSPTTEPGVASKWQHPDAKWIPIILEIKPNMGAASGLAAGVDNTNQSYAMVNQLGTVPTLQVSCSASDAGCYSTFLMFNVSARALTEGVAKVNGHLGRVTEKNIFRRNANGTMDLKFWVHVTNGTGRFEIPAEQIDQGIWTIQGSTLWMGVPPKFRDPKFNYLVTYPASDALRSCSGRGGDANCGLSNYIDPDGQFFRAMKAGMPYLWRMRADERK